MLLPKEFLEQQIHLIDEEVKEALRHEYGPAESGLFFVECQDRLASLSFSTKSLSASPSTHQVDELVNSISQLGALIDRIQHSRLGEFPWAFAEELRETATQLCKAKTKKTPLFFFSSEGRLDAYACHDEQKNVGIFTIPIFNVVFPRSLKHQVLIHPVLGHEIGHALLSLPEMATTKRAAEKLLFKVGPLSSVARFRWWLKGVSSARAKQPEVELEKSLYAWRDEFLCDLLGLQIMGPSFTPALFTMLRALDSSGGGISEEHPPPVCRFIVQRDAISAMGWMGPRTRNGAHRAEAGLWRRLSRDARGHDTVTLVDAAGVKATMRMLQKELGGSSVLFDRSMLRPVRGLVRQILNLVPPVGDQNIERDLPGSEVDFRSVIYAGWIALELRRAKAGRPNIDDVNRLCELGILQQRAIANVIDRAATGKASV